MRSLFLLLWASVVVAAAFEEGECDPLVPEYCMLPYPNDFWRIKTDSGYRLNFSINTLPIDDNGKPIDPVRGGFNDLHGWPVMPAITAYFHRMGDASIENCARWWNIEDSLLDSSPTILLDAETLQRVPHWVELDHSSNITEVTGKHALLIWPATALEFDRRYIVGINMLPTKDDDGMFLEESEAFRHMRDSSPPSVVGGPAASARQQHFENNVFAPLVQMGVKRSNLLLAWDFTTNDKQDVTGRMQFMRDDARKRLETTNGPEYEIRSVEYDPSELVAKRISGQFKMPTYLNTHLPEPSARLVLDTAGLPVYQGDEWYEFEVVVPKAFVESARSAGIMQYGHGLFGSYREVEYGSSTYMYEDATDYGYIICASTWLGLSEQDIAAVGEIILKDVTDFMYVPDRTTQGVVNALGLMQLMKGRFAQDPLMLTSTGESIVDTTKTAYFGNSEGGILGGVYMAMSQDVKRGCLGVPGGPYSLLLPRSLDFGIEFVAVKLRYCDPVDRINMMQVLQLLWDRGEPAGYMSSISRQPIEGTEAHEVLLHYGLGDAQVSWLAAHAMARSVDAVMYASNAKENEEKFFGFDLLADDVVVTGRSGIQGWDYQSPQAPLINKPPCEEGDTHEDPRKDDRAQVQMGQFFIQGQISNVCGGTCTADKSGR